MSRLCLELFKVILKILLNPIYRFCSIAFTAAELLGCARLPDALNPCVYPLGAAVAAACLLTGAEVVASELAAIPVCASVFKRCKLILVLFK